MPRPATKKRLEKLEQQITPTSPQAVQVFYVKGGAPDDDVQAFLRERGHVIDPEMSRIVVRFVAPGDGDQGPLVDLTSTYRRGADKPTPA
jgi:hypothetical protein